VLEKAGWLTWLAWLQMFARKYQRIAADYASKGAVFLEILGDETAETRVSACSATPARGYGNHGMLLTCRVGTPAV
jgi:hypothetical protein